MKDVVFSCILLALSLVCGLLILYVPVVLEAIGAVALYLTVIYLYSKSGDDKNEK